LRGFYDSDETNRGSLRGVPIIGPGELDRVDRSAAFAVGLGSPVAKKRAVQEVEALGFARAATLLHPSVQLDASIKIDAGVVVCAGSILTVDIHLRYCSAVYLSCTVGHDTIIGAYSQLSPGCNVAGRVVMGEGVFMGTNSATVERLRIGDWATVGAGAIVIGDVAAATTVVGVPARPVQRRSAC
jgi:sugar O-acyltransferase (sialic acid O-acetyltransferase NeuD family)